MPSTAARMEKNVTQPMEENVTQPLATIVVVPRERFGAARRSLENIYENTREPFDLVYVDGKSPGRVRRYLEERASERGFRRLRFERYLTPNEARNLGLGHVRTKYVVFVDNDVLVTPGWLEALVECAEETGAEAVGPLYLEGDLDARRIHAAGGEIRIDERDGERVLFAEMGHCQETLGEVGEGGLERELTGLVEFHCVLVRRDWFDEHGPLDEGLETTREHVDLSMAIAATGGEIYIEPRSRVTYVLPFPLDWSDFPFYFFRWDAKKVQASIDRFEEKWGVRLDARREGLARHRRMLAVVHRFPRLYRLARKIPH